MDGSRAPSGSWENRSIAGMYAATSDRARVLREGGTLGPEVDYPEISELQIDVIRVNFTRLAVLFADFDHARTILAELPRNASGKVVKHLLPTDADVQPMVQQDRAA